LAKNNLDGAARQLRAPGSQQANAEELLAELVRLVDSSGPAPGRSRAPAGPVSERARTSAEPMSKPGETGAIYVEPLTAPASDNSYSNDPTGVDFATGRRAGVGKFTVLALVLVGAAALGSIFWLKRAESGLPDAPPLIGTTLGPTTTEPGSNLTVATSSEAGVTAKDVTEPAQSKGASPEDRPTDPNARSSLNNPPQSDLAPTADASAAKPLAAPVDTTAVSAPIAVARPMASQSLDSKPAPAVSLPRDSAQIATPTPSPTDSGAAAHSTNAPLPPVRPVAKAKIETPGVAHQATSRLDLPTKLSSKSDARVVVAKADATGAGAAERSDPPRPEASVKTEKGAKTLKVAPAPTEAQAAPPEQPVAAQQPKPNPVVHAFRNMVGAVASFIPFVPH
jgi:hypothetical protein